MSSSRASHFSLTLASQGCRPLISLGVRLPRVRPAKNLIRVIGKLRQSSATAFSSLTVLVPPLLLENCAKSGALLVGPFLNGRKRFRQKFVQPVAQNFDNDLLTQRFGFHCFVCATILEAIVVLNNDRQVVRLHLFPSQR